MIIDDDTPVANPDPAPAKPGPVSFPSRADAIRESGHPDAGRLALRYADYETAARSAAELLTGVRASAWRSFVRARDDADATVKRVVGTIRGNADRLASEAVDLLTKTVTRARDNFGYRLSQADAALWNTSARPVATRDETDGVLSMPPLAAAYAMIEDRAAATDETATTDSGTSDDTGALGGGPSAVPSNRRTVEDVLSWSRALGESLRKPETPVSDGSDPVAGPPPPCGGGTPSMADEIVKELTGAGFLPAPYPAPPYNGVPEIGSFGSVQWWLTGKARGGLSDPWEGGYPRGDGVHYTRTMMTMPDGSTLGGLVMTRYIPQGLPSTPELDVLRGSLFPPDQWPVMLEEFGAGCLPTAPPVDPPAYSPPPPDSAPPPPPPDPACCPAPDPVRESFDRTRPVAGIGAPITSETNWCEYVNGLLARLETLPGAPPPPPSGGSGSSVVDLGVWLAGVASGGAVTITDTLKFLASPVAGSVAEGLALTFTTGQTLAKAAVSALTSPTETNLASMGFVVAELSAASWGESVSGAPLKYIYKDFDYALKYMLPKNIPDQSTIDKLYLTSRIDDAEWECYTRSLGNLPRPHRESRDADITTPNVSEQVDLYMREKIDYTELRIALEKFGVKNRGDINKWIELREQIPQFADIVRFMVRDTENAAVVAEGQLDAEFLDNFRGQLSAWAKQQGISDDLALRFWRAHWELPSPTMAYQMLHRLRPGRVAPELVTTYESVRKLLGTADYAPGWRDRMMAVSYLTPTRTDIKQGYSRGVYTRPQILEMLQDTGLDKNGAEDVAKLYDFEKTQFARTRTEKQSAYTVRGILNDYIDAYINEREATTLLKEFGFDDARIGVILASADLRAVVKTRKACAKAVRRQYFVGRITETDAVRLLTDRGYDPGAAEEVAKEWACERSAGVQEVPARKNLEWAVSGVIPLDEFARRLVNLRYGNDDIERYVSEATRRMAEATAKAAAKAIRDAIAELRRREADAKKRLADLEKRIKDAEKRAGGDKKKQGD